MDAGYGARYADLYRRHWWWRARETLLQRELDRCVGRSDTGHVLDFGCGDGLFFDVLRRYGTPHGIEPNAQLLDPNGPWRASISTVPIAFDASQTARYRLIVALDVLEHIAEPEPVLLELARRLEPGGWIVATVPAFQSLWTAHDDLNHHVRRFRTAQLEALVRTGGLEIVESRYFFVWLAVAKWVVARAEAVLHPTPRSPGVPWAPINAAALAVSRVEQAILGRVRPPFGSSALVIARAPD